MIVTKEHPILFQGAIDSEIAVLLTALEDREEREVNKYPFYVGRIGETPVVVMKTFMGMANAAAATITAITAFSPACIVNQGICGGHDPELRRGDFLISRDVINDSCMKLGPDKEHFLSGADPIGTELPCGFQTQDPIPMHVFYHSDEALMVKAEEAYRIYQAEKDPEHSEDFPRLHIGRMASCDLWIDREDVMNAVIERFDTSGEDMETSASAQMCTAFGIPFLSVRTPSNSLLRKEEFVEAVSAKLQEMLIVFAKRFRQEQNEMQK